MAQRLEPTEAREVARHGGRRDGAGRKPAAGRKRHEHRARPFHHARLPVHVVLRVTGAVGRLRRRRAYQAVRAAMIKTIARTDFRIVHLSIRGSQIQLLCEADDRIALANGVRGLCVSAARRLNLAISLERGVKRRGRVFTDRYHATTIAHPRQARNALAFVLNNWQQHRDGDRGAASRRVAARRDLVRRAQVDPYSTAVWFSGWIERGGAPLRWPRDYEPLPSMTPRTWLLAQGWKQAAPAPRLWELPGSWRRRTKPGILDACASRWRRSRSH